jgi:hypothetical protein
MQLRDALIGAVAALEAQDAPQGAVHIRDVAAARGDLSSRAERATIVKDLATELGVGRRQVNLMLAQGTGARQQRNPSRAVQAKLNAIAQTQARNQARQAMQRKGVEVGFAGNLRYIHYGQTGRKWGADDRPRTFTAHVQGRTMENVLSLLEKNSPDEAANLFETALLHEYGASNLTIGEVTDLDLDV